MSDATNTPPSPRIGVEMLGTGSAIPDRVMSNADLEKVMDTSDEWIVQRTGISERRRAMLDEGETVTPLATRALNSALEDSGVDAGELDLVILATMSSETTCPPSACRLAANVGAGDAGAFDLSAACCGFVYSMNVADGLIRSGAYRTIAVVGADTITKYVKYNTSGRTTAILFGDAAGATILRATDDTSKGVVAQAMHADGGRWSDLYIPHVDSDYPEGDEASEDTHSTIRMNGRAVFRFAVGTFPDLIAETLEKAGLEADDIAQFVCHQSNARILQAARDRFGVPEDRLLVNINRFGNTVAASVPLCLDELRAAGKINKGDRIMLVGFGGGLTWGSSLWQL